MLPWLIGYAVGVALTAVTFGFVRERVRRNATRLGFGPAVSLVVEQYPPPWLAPAWPSLVLAGIAFGLFWLVTAGPGRVGAWLARKAGG